MSGSAVLTVAVKTVTAVTISPTSPSIAAGGMQQFTASVTYSDGTTGTPTTTVTWTSSNTSVATITSDGVASAVAVGSTTITATVNNVSGTDTLTVTVAPQAGVNVTTWHMDTNRSGLNASEQTLTPANVAPATFGKLFSYLVDGYVYAEPLLMSNITVNGSTHNVLYAATENDSVYAFDADNYGTGAPLWQVSLLQAGEAPIVNGPVQPFQGITSTPVIDPSTNTIYVVSAQKLNSSSNATFRLNALDITTGAQKFGGPVTIQATVPGTNSDSLNGMVSLTTACVQRAALLLANGNVYIGFGGCHSGWLLAYAASTLKQVGVFNMSPNMNGEGTYASAGGVWMGSGGPAADAAGNVYITTGNGPWDGLTSFGDSVVKFSPTLQLEDYFTPSGYAYMNCQDADLAAGGLLLIPGTTQAVAGGKTGKLYMVNTSNLGHEQPNDAGASDTLFFESGLINPYSATCTDGQGAHTEMINSYENFGTAAYFNGSVYVGITPTATNVPAGVGQFIYSASPTPALTSAAYTASSQQENTRGTTPFISANGTTNGVLWMIDQGQPLQSPQPSTSATLRAFDPENLSNELYNSSINSADTPGYGIKFTSPVVANGKVYISTGHDPVTTANPKGELDVYGLR
jgi:hypothetical protein